MDKKSMKNPPPFIIPKKPFPLKSSVLRGKASSFIGWTPLLWKSCVR